MRTEGTFREIWWTVRQNNEPNITDPVIRREDGVWILESALEPARDADLETTLEDFLSYWIDDTDEPTAYDIADYIRAIERDEREPN